jgi:hypothetical protein
MWKWHQRVYYHAHHSCKIGFVLISLLVLAVPKHRSSSGLRTDMELGNELVVLA